MFVLLKINRLAVYSTLNFGPKIRSLGCSARRSNVENNSDNPPIFFTRLVCLLIKQGLGQWVSAFRPSNGPKNIAAHVGGCGTYDGITLVHAAGYRDRCWTYRHWPIVLALTSLANREAK